jgi:MSHA biogenesis protein MshJ
VGPGPSAAADGHTTPASEPVTLAGSHVFKHGVRVVVEGTYLDLLSYVARLEKQPWQVYWSRTVMSSDYPKAQIELTLYTLSLDKAWLVV